MKTSLTAPCVQDPEAWNLPTNKIAKLQPDHIDAALHATDTCVDCPLFLQCRADKPASYEDRTAQGGQIFEPKVGWLEFDDWLKLAGYHRCAVCDMPTKRRFFCSRQCSGQAHRGEPKPQKTVELPSAVAPVQTPVDCDSTGTHDSLWAYKTHGCRCPKAVERYRETLRRAAAQRAEINGHTVKYRRPLEEVQAEVMALTAAGLSAPKIAMRLGLTARTVANYRARARAAA